MPIYFHGISISNVLITPNKKRPWKFWQNAELNGCVRRVEKNNRAILLGQKCCVHLHAWVPIPAKGELPCHSTTTTFVPFHYLISHAPAVRSFLICMVISLSLSLSVFKEWIWQCPFCFIYWLFCFVLKMILSLFIPSQRGCRSSDELLGESPHEHHTKENCL